MTIGEAAVYLGMPDNRNSRQRLRRYLLARETELEKQVMTRTRGPRGCVRFHVTKALLRRVCPELFDSPSEIEQTIKDTVRSLRRELTAIVERIDDLEAMQAAAAREIRELKSVGHDL